MHIALSLISTIMTPASKVNSRTINQSLRCGKWASKILMTLASILILLAGCDKTELDNNKDLKEKLKTLTQQNETLTSRVTNQNNIINQNNINLIEKTVELTKINDNFNIVQSKIKSQLQTLTDTNLKLQNEYLTLTTERNSIKSLHKNALNDAAHKQNTIDKLTTDINSLDRELTKTSTQLTKSDNSLIAIQDALKKEQTGSHKLITNLNFLKVKLKKTIHANIMLDKEFHAEEAKTKKLTNKLYDAQKQIKKLKKSAKPSKSESEMRSANKKAQTKIKKLEANLKSNQNTITKTKKELKTLKGKYIKTTTYLKKVTAENKKLKKKISELEDK